MKKQVLIALFMILFILPAPAQVVQDSLTLEWGATVNFGSFG